MKLTATEGRTVPTLNLDVAKGDTFEVDDETGAELIEQGWCKAAPKSTTTKEQ